MAGRLTITSNLWLARLLALAIPSLLIAGAYISQYGFGLYPCEMCWWQRYPHFVAIGLALLAFIVPPVRLWVILAALAILISGAIGAYHAGVEYGWWYGITSCARLDVPQGANALDTIMNTPLIRCDEAQWRLIGISLAGWNFLISTIGGLSVFWLLLRKESEA